jgi:hypothetical protein
MNTIEWVKSPAVPPGVMVIVSCGVVVWLGQSKDAPEIMPWPDPISVNCNAVDFDIIAKTVRAREKGVPYAKPR